MGKLSDDVEALRGFLGKPADEPIATWHELGPIYGILRAIEHPDRPT